MEFDLVLKSRRSVRTFSEKTVPHPTLIRILDAARLAPSACNYQPWRFIVVRDPITRDKLGALCRGQHFISQAPIILICCGKPYPNPFNWIGDHLFLMDLAIAIDHLTLAARNEGLATCWIGAFDHEPIRRLLAVPPDYSIAALIPLGFPANPTAFNTRADRLPLSQIVSSETYGTPWNP